jgi:hypothetical protein
LNLDQLKKALQPWMQTETWYTGHRNDDERFHRALKNAFDQLGVGMSSDDFREVMMELATELHPDWEPIHCEAIIGRFVARAEHIRVYLMDVAGDS